ncbi:MAG: hypothetical protein V1851_01300 [Patescibacteria group bacterium]
MKKIILLSFIIMVTPFLGIPSLWKNVIFVFAGLIIILNTFSENKKNTSHSREEVKDNVYVENDSSAEIKTE